MKTKIELFPFETVREKQDKLLEKTKETVENKRNLVAHAPTGLGKTAATLTPCIEHKRKEKGKVFFLTPRHSQHEIAIDTVKKINKKHNTNIRTADLIGKSHLCEAPPGQTGGKTPPCPRHDKTYQKNHVLSDEAKRKVKELKNQQLTAEEVKKRCRNVCPYAITLELCKKADVIVADYFHIFHPGVKDNILEKAETTIEDSILIVDEAHNLPSRTRSLFTYTISLSLLNRAITETETFGYYQEQENLEQLLTNMRRLAREKLGQTTHEANIVKKDLKDIVSNFYNYEKLIVDLETAAEEIHEEKEEESYCLQIAETLRQWDGPDEGFSRTIERKRHNNNREIRIRYSCLNPQISTKKPLNNAHSSILMSATLTPMDMYTELTGLETEKTSQEAYSSPFPSDNKLELAVKTLTTRYKERDDSTYQKYAWILQKSIETVPGNTAIFFPSYKFKEEVEEQLKKQTNRKIFSEKRNNNKEEKAELLTEFKKYAEKEDNSILTGVAAGSYGEGIDLPGEQLKAVFIVGLPLRQPDLETKNLIDYYDQKFGKGWDYAYNFPAMNTAIQAAGRCIRSKRDKGAVIYMDKRYTWSQYRKAFPPNTHIKSTKAPWKELENFFN